MNLAKETSNELLYVGFNQDSSCFACATKNGFAIFNVEPFRETFRRVFSHGGIGIVEMLFRCNLIAIVGGGSNPRYPTNKVMIWDDYQSRCIGELMFKSEVLAVKLRRDRVVVVLNTKIYVYRFSDLKLLDQITTLPNPRALISLCSDVSNNVLAVPGLAKGSIRIEHYSLEKSNIIKAHDADLSQFALNIDGSRIASASEKGTLIRLWDTHTGDPLRELRRGMDRAEIYCIAFNASTTFLACSSDKGTVHIFALSDNVQPTGSSAGQQAASLPPPPSAQQLQQQQQQTQSSSSSGSGQAEGGDNTDVGGAFGTGNTPQSSNKSLGGLSFLRGVLPPAMIPKYAVSEWSFAQVHGIDAKSVCAFDKEHNRIIILAADGTYSVSSFEEGGECSRITTASFIRSDDATTTSIL